MHDVRELMTLSVISGISMERDVLTKSEPKWSQEDHLRGAAACEFVHRDYARSEHNLFGNWTLHDCVKIIVSKLSLAATYKNNCPPTDPGRHVRLHAILQTPGCL